MYWIIVGWCDQSASIDVAQLIGTGNKLEKYESTKGAQ